MTDTILYRTDLAEKALPELLWRVRSRGEEGVVEGRRDGIRKQVHYRDGALVDAASTDQEDWLGYHLRRRGRLTVEEFVATMRERDRSMKRYGTLLVERALMSPLEVHEAVREQVEGIVLRLFDWGEGEAFFRPGQRIAEGPGPRIHLPARRAILLGVQRMPTDRWISRLGGKETVLEPLFEAKDLVEIGLDAAEYNLLSAVDGVRSIYDLGGYGSLDPAADLRLLYAFQVLNLVRPRAAEPRRGPIKLQMKTTGDDLSG